MQPKRGHSRWAGATVGAAHTRRFSTAAAAQGERSSPVHATQRHENLTIVRDGDGEPVGVFFAPTRLEGRVVFVPDAEVEA